MKDGNDKCNGKEAEAALNVREVMRRENQ
jgi:hypothetical protein